MRIQFNLSNKKFKNIYFWEYNKDGVFFQTLYYIYSDYKNPVNFYKLATVNPERKWITIL